MEDFKQASIKTTFPIFKGLTIYEYQTMNMNTHWDDKYMVSFMCLNDEGFVGRSEGESWKIRR